MTADGQGTDGEIAARLAGEVESSVNATTWRKVTTLLDLFGAYRLTDDVRARMAAAIAAAGLDAKPPITDVERYETVRLTVRSDSATGDGAATRSRTISRLIPLEEALR